jgi:hypothetical protein
MSQSLLPPNDSNLGELEMRDLEGVLILPTQILSNPSPSHLKRLSNKVIKPLPSTPPHYPPSKHLEFHS